MKVSGVEVHAKECGKELVQILQRFDIRYETILIISPLIVLVVTEGGAIVGAGKLSEFKSKMRKDKARQIVGSLPKYQGISFHMGLEPKQAQLVDDAMLINAAGLLKLGTIFGGRLKEFLSGNDLNSAQSFMSNVATRIASGEDPNTFVGSQVRHSMNKLDRAAETMLGVRTLEEHLAGPTSEEIRRRVTSIAGRSPYRL